MSTQVTITIDAHGTPSASPNPCVPDPADKGLTFTIATSGYHYNQTKGFNNCGISIKNKNGTFAVVSASTTSVAITDSGQDDKNKHDYTLHIQADSGAEIDYDPVIKDHT